MRGVLCSSASEVLDLARQRRLRTRERRDITSFRGGCAPNSKHRRCCSKNDMRFGNCNTFEMVCS